MLKKINKDLFYTKTCSFSNIFCWPDGVSFFIYQNQLDIEDCRVKHKNNV